ncbi:hypothetical protein QSU92_05475 [Microbacterium sp. ET2]|uniref:hypothetical protein n=1 Tax=Microbacterium albipurpureum TaxID=3050384 RepID=UPI00259CFB66|nr:hypothetical protein [Microbacterium sp. ET2 (Ac-2212)]WJL96627.1 hypothetical protein QSU92_05475 [Microbacterium sp. ET2 (Ac-2212)]
MKTYYAGAILLGLGYAMLVGVVLIWDPTAPDANIGAGILATVGVPCGALGGALILANAALRIWERTQRRKAPAESISKQG